MESRSIPTLYNNCMFRSRLEAQWAAWFDLAGWKWTYEPVDMYGWCPDFCIVGYNGPILVEVKPAHWICENRARPKLDISLFKKALRAEPDILLLGVGPCYDDHLAFIGMCNEPNPYGQDFATAVSQKTTDDSGVLFGYCSIDQGYYDRVTGYYPGGSWDGEGHELAMPFWNQAGNKVRWGGRKQ